MRTLYLCLILVVLSLSTLGQDASGPQKGYLFGPGDQIKVTVPTEKEYDFVATVDEDGRIEVPFADKPIVAQCKTERELRAELSTLLGKYLREPQLVVTTEKKSRAPATVYGEVTTPVRIEMHRRVTLAEALAIAGGPKEEASGLVQISRPQPPMCGGDEAGSWKADSPDPNIVPSRTFSMADIRTGREDSNPLLFPGDVVYVHKAAPVYVTGEVTSPQGIYMRDRGLTLMQALARVGGPKATASRKNITVRRIKPGTNDQYDMISANYEKIMKGEQKDILLQPYDVVEVGQKKDSIGMQILKTALGAGRVGIQAVTTATGYRVID